MRIWTLGAKVPDLDAEIAFVEKLGGELVLDDRIPFGEREFRVPLLRFGDKYLHLAEEMVYESSLELPLPAGLCHVVFEVDDLEATRRRRSRPARRRSRRRPGSRPASAPATWPSSARPAASSSS